MLICLSLMIIAPMIQLQLLVGKLLIDEVVVNNVDTIERRLTMLVFYTVLGGIVLWLQQLLERLCNFIEFYMDIFVTLDLRRTFYGHLHRLPYQFFQAARSASICTGASPTSAQMFSRFRAAW